MQAEEASTVEVEEAAIPDHFLVSVLQHIICNKKDMIVSTDTKSVSMVKKMWNVFKNICVSK